MEYPISVVAADHSGHIHGMLPLLLAAVVSGHYGLKSNHRICHSAELCGEASENRFLAAGSPDRMDRFSDLADERGSSLRDTGRGSGFLRALRLVERTGTEIYEDPGAVIGCLHVICGRARLVPTGRGRGSGFLRARSKGQKRSTGIFCKICHDTKKQPFPKRKGLFLIHYSAFLAVSTRASKASLSAIASSDRALRFISMPALDRPYMKRL